MKPPHRLLAGGGLAGWIVLLGATPPALLLPWDEPERTIAVGEVHTRPITVEPDAALLIRVDQHSIDLVIEARGPALSEPITVAAGNDRWGAEVLLLEAPGPYEIRIRPLKKSTWPGSYLLRTERVPPADPRRQALALLSRAGQEVYRDTAEDRVQAIADYHQALEIWKSLNDLPWQAETLVCLAFQDGARSDFKVAVQETEEALELWRKLGRPSREAEALNWLGSLSRDTDNPEKARAPFEEARCLWNRLGLEYDEMEARGNLCGVDRKLGALSTALPCYQEILRFFQARKIPEQEMHAFQNIGGVYYSQGDLDTALAWFSRSLELAQSLEDRNVQVENLNNIAAAYRKQANWQKALRIYGESLPLLPPDDDVLRAPLLNNIGYAYNHLGAPDRARPYLEEALALYRKIGDRSSEITGLNNLGANARRLGNLDKALELHQQALDLSRELGTKAQQATSLSHLAETRLDAGDGAATLQDVDAALALRKGGENPQPEATLLLQRGRALVLVGRVPEARETLQAALEKWRALHAPSGEIETLVALGEADRDLGQAAEARDHIEAALEKIEELRAGGLTSPDLRAAFFATRHRAFALLIDLLMDFDAAEPGRGHDRAAFAVSERARARTLLDALRGEPTAPPADLEEISGGLDKGTVLLEYSLGDRRSFLWTIDHTGRLRSAVLPGRGEIEALAHRAYDEMRISQMGAADSGEAAEALSRTLLVPVWSDVAKLERLVIVPDGALGLVPFAALPVPPPGHGWNAKERTPLLERLETVYIPSATTLAAQRSRPPRPRGAEGRKAIILADPVFRADNPLMPAFDRLPATRDEARNIARLVPRGQVEIRFGADANRDAVLSGALRGHRIVHFATHAVADMTTPEGSGLVLSQADAEGHSREGFLGLDDLYKLDLDADLVVLSACVTARGKEVRGEGLMSLTRGFEAAGVPRVVASLWTAKDRATAELMKRFYSGMWHDGLPAAAALRRAQQELRRQRHYGPPAYWAAFVLQGDWR